jgi:hypothetical protein
MKKKKGFKMKTWDESYNEKRKAKLEALKYALKRQKLRGNII